MVINQKQDDADGWFSPARFISLRQEHSGQRVGFSQVSKMKGEMVKEVEGVWKHLGVGVEGRVVGGNKYDGR